MERQAEEKSSREELQGDRGRGDCPSPWDVSGLLDYKRLRTIRGS